MEVIVPKPSSATAERPKYRTLSVHIPSDLRAALQQIANREASYLSTVIRRACCFEVARVRRAIRKRDRLDDAA